MGTKVKVFREYTSSQSASSVAKVQTPLFPLVGEFSFPLFECRKTSTFATLGEGGAGAARRSLTWFLRS